MRIAVIDRKRCNPKKCSEECRTFCPKNRAGINVVEVGEFSRIDEEKCIGCGICVRKCPFNAVHIVNLPEQEDEPIHQYGENGFRVFSLPILKKDSVVGLIGPNGAGKTTILDILAGNVIPNFGDKPERERVISRFSGTENQKYFEDLYSDKIKVSFKPQKVDDIPRVYKQEVKTLLGKSDERGLMSEVISIFELETTLDKTPKQLSGGELQRVAIAATLLKDADLYIFDEPSSYLDIKQRLNIARGIRRFTENKMVLVVEHDLVLLDYLTDYVHVVFGKPAVFGIVSQSMSNKEGINSYIEGYLPAENMKFRESPLEFMKPRSHKKAVEEKVFSWGKIGKKLGEFELEINPASIGLGGMVGCIGPNGIGKTTFARMLAGELEPDKGKIDKKVKVAYKPQYLKAGNEKLVSVVRSKKLIAQLNLEKVQNERLSELSGGELQRAAIALTLMKDADIYVFDEPSAHLDVEEKINSAKVIRNAMKKKETAAIVIDHDLMLLDYLSERIIVFEGIPGKMGETHGPMEVEKGMNSFLKGLGITFRREPQTKRPRANKEDSVKDREQKRTGDYYY